MAEIQPDYYKGRDGHDLFDRFEHGLLTPDEVVGFYKGNVIKYLTRFKKKNGLEDLKKARVYLTRLIDFEKVKEDEK
ncbi:DUF3310 domain-containing protein [Ligilactobacillus sp. LYQ139]|uniref:DUF3310 domain-containing protein n=1 Tax=Ligilactobacillus sp. LYQ139 TaxID=3378800 RepID=UPI0038519F7B